MADKNALTLGIDIKTSNGVIKTLTDLTSAIDLLKNKVNSIDKSVVDSITGGKASNLKAMKSQLNVITKDLDALSKQSSNWMKNAGDGSKVLNKSLQETIKKVGDVDKIIKSASKNVITIPVEMLPFDTVSGDTSSKSGSKEKASSIGIDDAFPKLTKYFTSLTNQIDTFSSKLSDVSLQKSGGLSKLGNDVDSLALELYELADANKSWLSEDVKNNPQIQMFLKETTDNMDTLRERVKALNEERVDKIFSVTEKTITSGTKYIGMLEKIGISIKLAGEKTDKYGDTIKGTAVILTDISEPLLGVIDKFKAVTINALDTKESLLDSANSLKNLGQNLSENSTKNMESGKTLYGLNKATSIAGSGISKFGNAMDNMSGKLATAGAGAAVAVGVASAAFSGLTLISGETEESIKDNLDAMKDEVSMRKEVTDLINSGNRDSVQREIDDLNNSIIEQRQIMENIRNTANENTMWYDELRTVAARAFGDSTIYGQAGDAMRESANEIENLTDKVAVLTSVGAKASLALAETRKELESLANDAIRKIEESEEDLFKLRFDLLNKTDEMQTDLLDANKTYESETSALIEKRQNDDKNNLAEYLDGVTSAEKTFQKESEKSVRDHYNNLKTLETEYINALSKIEDTFKKDSIKAEDDYKDERAKSIGNYEEATINKRTEYEETIIKMETDFNKERIERQKSLADELFEAEMANDALNFFLLKRNAKKEEKDAVDDHQEALTETRKNFEDETKQEAIEHQKNLEQMASQMIDERKQRSEQHILDVATAKKQFDDNIKQADEQHKQSLSDDKFRYDEQRASAARAFEKQKQDIETARAVEDNDRLERLATRRQELNDAFDLELEYYERRNQVLRDFLEDTTPVEHARDIAIGSAITGGAGRLNTQSQNQLISDALAGEIANFEQAFGNNVDTMSRSNEAQYRILKLAYNQATLAATHATSAFDVSSIINDTQYATAGVNPTQVLSEAIEAGFNRIVTGIYDRSANDLEYTDPREAENARRANIMGQGDVVNFGGLGYLGREVVESQSGFYEDMGIQQTDFGLQTRDEMARQRRGELDIRRHTDQRTLADMESVAETQIRMATENYDRDYAERERQNEVTLRTNREHFENRRNNENQLNDDLLTAREIANQENIDMEKYRSEAELALDEQNNQTRLDNTVTAFGNQTVLETEQDATLFESRLATENQNSRNINDTLVTANRNTNNTLKGILNAGSNSTVAIHRQLMQGILNVAITGLNQINRYISDMNKSPFSNKPGGSGGGSGGSGSGRKGLLAAKGALIDRPTLLIAGEGKTPELVVPFDESKGIPDNILRKPNSGLTRIDNQNDMTLNAILGALGKIQYGMQMSVGDIHVGSNLSRDEVKQQFQVLQQAIVDVVYRKTNIQ